MFHFGPTWDIKDEERMEILQMEKFQISQVIAQ